jgi:5-methylcytosine-specific restriction endonuclease McrA
MRNRTPWNKGMKMSKKHCDKLKQSWIGRYDDKPNPLLGRKLSDKHIRALTGPRPHTRGKNAPNWRGGITKQDRLERLRFQRTIQKQVFKRDDYTCQFCGERGGKLQVDHIQPWAEYVEGRFDMDNCRTLCMECHYKITFGRPMPSEIKSWGHNLKEVI